MVIVIAIACFSIDWQSPCFRDHFSGRFKGAEPYLGEKADVLNKKIRQKLRMVIKWARAQGFLRGDDSVELAGQALPNVKASGAHFRAVSCDELPRIITRLRGSKISFPMKLALEFLLLTACRTSEVLGLQWGEIDFDDKRWAIPASGMKSGKSHKVPLTDQMVVVLRKAKSLNVGNGFVFPSGVNGRPLFNNTLRQALQKHRKVDATLHGMRSAFKDWAAETTNFANEVSEMGLGQVISNKVEAAYRRGNFVSRRRQLMED